MKKKTLNCPNISFLCKQKQLCLTYSPESIKREEQGVRASKGQTAEVKGLGGSSSGRRDEPAARRVVLQLTPKAFVKTGFNPLRPQACIQTVGDCKNIQVCTCNCGLLKYHC